MVAALKNLSPAEHERISAAIAEAQAGTHARFVFVVVPASDRYRLYPVVWGAALALLALGGIAFALPHIGVRPAFIIVAALFVAASLILEWRPLRMMVVPRHTKHDHARALAHREFAVRILSHPERQGGVLFFISLAERYAEIIADPALHAAAGQMAWDRTMAEFTALAARGRLADAVIGGVNACGALLKQHHPQS